MSKSSKRTTERFSSLILLFGILLVAIFLRVYRLDKLTTFGGDQGIDFLVVRDMVLYHKWTLIGIKTSIGAFFQGPLYLYMLFPFFSILSLQPIAGAIAAMVFSVSTLALLYITVKKYFSTKTALISSLLFAVSPQFIIFGNTPLYQNFLPLFIALSLYYFLKDEDNFHIRFLLGLSVGLGIELHLLNVSLAIAFLLYYLLFVKRNLKLISAYLLGIVVGFGPTLLFELRHQFLNTKLFLAYQSQPHSPVSLSNILTQWVTGAGIFLGGNSSTVGVIILLILIPSIFIKKISGEAYKKLRTLTLLTIAVTAILSLRFTAFEPHYILPVWILFLIMLPIIIGNTFSKTAAHAILGLLIVFNLYASSKELNNNHGYSMPSGWTLSKINQIGRIVSEDSKNHSNFNVASLLDGNTRSYPIRYSTIINGGVPDTVENYPSNDFLYVAYGQNKQGLYKVPTWEVVSLKPFTIGAEWNLGDNIYLYRLDRLKKTNE